MTAARYGRFISMQSHRTPEQQQQLESHMLAMYPQVLQEINDRVSRIRQLVASYDPLDVLKRGFWTMSGSMMGKESEADYGIEDIAATKMVEYLQAVIVSTPPSTQRKDLTDDDWKELCREVGQLYKQLGLTFHLVNSAHRKATESDYDIEYDRFCVEWQMQATFVRATRYAIHDLEFLMDFLVAHDDEFQMLFGVSSADFVKAIGQIHNSLSRDSVAVHEELYAEYQQTLNRTNELAADHPPGTDFLVAMEQLQAEPGWHERRASIMGRLMGLDLFDLQRITGLPPRLLEELSLEPGQDDHLFSPGDYAGWPLRVFPTKFRPFLKVGDRYYCFDPVNLMDNVYRAVQKLICRLDPDYAEVWNAQQKEASERRPIDLLQDLLPAAQVFSSVTYQCAGEGDKNAKWCELDGLVLYDDVLFAVEVKAGAFAWVPPLTNFPAYLKSIESLLKRPAEQASRFLYHLRQSQTATLYDSKHNEVASLSKDAFRVVIPLCVTLDPLTTAAYKIRELESLGITVPEPVCCMLIDDLRIYRDVFSSPVTFAHFMQKRYEAECDTSVNANDELDHLGLYLEFVNYIRQARTLKRNLGTEITGWGGYRKVIDRFFFELNDRPDKAMRPRPR